MSHTPNELAEEFPEKIELMHKMKMDNPHFARLSEDYHEINRAIHRAESNIEPTDDFNDVEMRKRRLALKDEIWAMLSV